MENTDQFIYSRIQIIRKSLIWVKSWKKSDTKGAFFNSRLGSLYFTNKLSGKFQSFGDRATAGVDFYLNIDDKHKRQLLDFVQATVMCTGNKSIFPDYELQTYQDIEVVHYILLFCFNFDAPTDFENIFQGTSLSPAEVVADISNRIKKNNGYPTRAAVDLLQDLDDDLLLKVSDYSLEKNRKQIEFNRDIKKQIEGIRQEQQQAGKNRIPTNSVDH